MLAVAPVVAGQNVCNLGAALKDAGGRCGFAIPVETKSEIGIIDALPLIDDALIEEVVVTLYVDVEIVPERHQDGFLFRNVDLPVLRGSIDMCGSRVDQSAFLITEILRENSLSTDHFRAGDRKDQRTKD